MFTKHFYRYAGIAGMALLLVACKSLDAGLVQKNLDTPIPTAFATQPTDTVNSATINWRDYFSDRNLVTLIDSALKNNQELNITLQEMEIARNEIMARKGEYLPFLDVGAGGGVEKVGRYTSKGASEATTEIEPGREMPDPVPDVTLAAYATWEVDIWHKLRSAKDAAMNRYMATTEGKNFLVTNLVAEIAQSYYELLSLDNQLDLINQNIELQSNVLEIVRAEKEATRVTELAVRRFEAQVLHTKSLQYSIKQRIIETENRINFLVGRYPQPVQRNSTNFTELVPDTVYAGLPTQLIQNRPDVRQAEYILTASKLDLKVARACFYPSLRISAGVGLQSFNPAYLLRAPESILFNMLGDLAAPLVNRKALKANYFNSNARQNQATYNYERTVLMAYLEVSNQLSNINNLQQTYELKSQEVAALNASVDISNNLFASARADYMEVLMTQRDVLEAKFDLIETKQQQLSATVAIYRALGGGWR